jgi:hypothetical protein
MEPISADISRYQPFVFTHIPTDLQGLTNEIKWRKIKLTKPGVYKYQVPRRQVEFTNGGA